MTKNLDPIVFNSTRRRADLAAFQKLLRSKKALDERADIQAFFKKRQQLASFIDTFTPNLGPATLLGYFYCARWRAGSVSDRSLAWGRLRSLTLPARHLAQWSCEFPFLGDFAAALCFQKLHVNGRGPGLVNAADFSQNTSWGTANKPSGKPPSHSGRLLSTRSQPSKGKGFIEMCKKLAVVALLVAAGVLALQRFDIKCCRKAKSPEQQVQDVRDSIAKLAGEKAKLIDAIAVKEVEVQDLAKEVANREANLDVRKKRVLALRAEVTTAKELVKAEGEGSFNETRARLDREYTAFRSAREVLASKKQVHAAARESLDADYQQLSAFEKKRDELIVTLDKAEAKLKKVPHRPDAVPAAG